MFDGARCIFIAPIAFEQIGAAHQDFAVVGETYVPAVRRGTDIARPRKLSALSRNDATGFFRLSVNFKNVDAVHVPKRHRLGRQWSAAADDELQAIEAKFVENRAKDRRMTGAVRRLVGAGHGAVPAFADMTAGETHRELVTGALQR